MADSPLLRRLFLRSSPLTDVTGRTMAFISAIHKRLCHYAAKTDTKNEKKQRQWFILPPFTSSVDGAALGKEISGLRSEMSGGVATTTALQWILRCCPQLPRSLVQKLFRLRQVRRESSNIASSDLGVQSQERQLRRVAAKDSMNFGDRIFLPITVQELPSEKVDRVCSDEEIKFLHSLVLYKDPAIIVVNKPPGIPVQGGIGIKRSLDVLAATYLRYEHSQPPRLGYYAHELLYCLLKDQLLLKQLLFKFAGTSISSGSDLQVHRLDRDSSGILVMGRTQLSATVLHSIFREKTFGASNEDLDNEKRTLQRRYWALVIGSPRRPEGLISVPLRKVVLDGGKSERITVIDNVQTISSQHAVTEYRVIESSSHGFTWLELSPLTGRKHQLRVHCAEVLGTPIVGDVKYGWHAHRKWKNQLFPHPERNLNEKLPNGKTLPFGLALENGNICEKHPLLHLHCKEMVLPNISLALQHAQLSSNCGLAELESLELVAPLPSHMQKSWDILNL